jgi:hypothetical protein
MIALDALKCARVEVQAPRHDAGEHHRGLALRAGRAFNCRLRNAGMLRLGFRHSASLQLAGARHSRSPMDANGGAVIEPVCSPEFRSHRSILLTFRNLIERRTEKRSRRRGERRDRFVLSPQATARPVATRSYPARAVMINFDHFSEFPMLFIRPMPRSNGTLPEIGGTHSPWRYRSWIALLPLDTDHCRAAVDHIEFTRRSTAHVDDATTAIRPAIIYTHDHCSAVPDVPDQDHGAEW